MKELGKVLGYCPTCCVAIGKSELRKQCARCGQLLFKENLLPEGGPAVTKQSKTDEIRTTPYPSSWSDYHKSGGNKY